MPRYPEAIAVAIEKLKAVKKRNYTPKMNADINDVIHMLEPLVAPEKDRFAGAWDTLRKDWAQCLFEEKALWRTSYTLGDRAFHAHRCTLLGSFLRDMDRLDPRNTKAIYTRRPDLGQEF